MTAVLLHSNPDRSQKFQPLAVQKLANSGCFKNMRTLSCKYTNNLNAWMTKLFKNFLASLDAKGCCKERTFYHSKTNSLPILQYYAIAG
jgi:hypothetical protein